MGILDQFDVTGQCVVITGAGTGLGKQMALHLAEAGADIVGVGRRAEPIEALGEEIRAKGRRYLGIPGCDATNSAQVNEMAAKATKEMGHVTGLINSAGLGGTGRGKTFPELTDEDWHSGIDSNLTSAFYTARALVPHFLEHGGGTVVNITSGWGFRAGRDNFMYAVGKGGVIQLARVLAMTYARENIRALCIAPGLFPHTDDTTVLTGLGQKQPAGRIGFPREIGPLAVFLMSPAAAYMSGETVLIDGGAIAAGLTPAGVIPRAEG